MPFVLLTIAMVAVYAVLVGELAKIIAGEAVAKIARSVGLGVLGAAAAVAAVVGEVRAGAVCPVVLTDGFVNAFWAQKLPAGALVLESSRVSRA